MLQSMRIDELDYEIIRELQADGRRPLREIARNLGIAEATVRLRLKRLQDEEIIRVIAFLDPTKLGPSLMALLFIKVVPGRHEAIVRTLEEWSEVCYLSTTIGEVDICGQALCADQTSLWELVQKMRELDGVSEVRILNEIEVHKIRFAIPSGNSE